MTEPTIWQILAELELLPHGAVRNYNPSARGSERDPRPQGEAYPPHEHFKVEYLAEITDTGRRTVYLAAVQYLRQAKGLARPEPLKPPDIEGDVLKMRGWTPKEIAMRLGGIVTQGQIRAWREKAGVDISTGYDPVRDESKRDKVTRLKKQGLGTNEIARACDMTKQAVSQMLKRAA